MIVLHVSTKGWKYAGVNASVWPIYLFWHAISRIGVCCFVMISGALFLGKPRGKNIEIGFLLLLCFGHAHILYLEF